MLKTGYYKTALVDYAKIILIMLVSFSKRIGKHIYFVLNFKL